MFRVKKIYNVDLEPVGMVRLAVEAMERFDAEYVPGGIVKRPLYGDSFIEAAEILVEVHEKFPNWLPDNAVIEIGTAVEEVEGADLF